MNFLPSPYVIPTATIFANVIRSSSKLIQYLISVTFIFQTGIPQHLTSTILKEKAVHYFSKSFFEGIEFDIISIRNQLEALHYLTEKKNN